MPKREKNILKEIELYASKKGFIPLRLNSGMAMSYTGYPIKLCPEGTSDLIIIINQGRVLWVETKTLTGKQRESQIQFQKEVEKLGHTYILARSVEEIEKCINLL